MTQLSDSTTTMTYDGTLEGFLSLVFDAYAFHIRPYAIETSSETQISLLGDVKDSTTSLPHAERVKVGVCNRAGFNAYRTLERAFLSCEQGRETTLFDYISGCMEGGYRFCTDAAHPAVAKVEKLALRTANEAENMRQFLRFELMESNVYFATINPSANVLPLIMAHFVNRFNTQPFLIYDSVHNLCGIYDLKHSYLATAENLQKPPQNQEESLYQKLWKTFYDALACEQRFNPDLRRSFMPKRYWKTLPEMTQAVAS